MNLIYPFDTAIENIKGILAIYTHSHKHFPKSTFCHCYVSGLSLCNVITDHQVFNMIYNTKQLFVIYNNELTQIKQRFARQTRVLHAFTANRPVGRFAVVIRSIDSYKIRLHVISQKI